MRKNQKTFLNNYIYIYLYISLSLKEFTGLYHDISYA